MWLFVGLGNPGDEYAGNRHNIGFMVGEAIAGHYSFPSFRAKFRGRLSEGKIAGEKVALLLPNTFMNNSGESVGPAAKFYKIPPERIVVFYDELDLEFGKLRVKRGGGSGGHNGIKSMEAHLGDQGFWRVRMGIGHPGDKSKVSNYVLSDFSKAEQKIVAPWVENVTKNCELMAQGKDGEFMTKVALDSKADAPVKKKKGSEDGV